MIRLHVLPDPWGINPSPFCLKVETYCRLADIPFVAVPTLPVRAPRRKLPFMSDGDKRVPDSGLIIEHLARRHGDPLDRDLSKEQRAQGHLIRRTCEESLYFVLLHFRWIDPAGWKVNRQALFGSLPPLARNAVPLIARRGIRRALYAQGYGRHPPEEITALGAADLGAVATTLEAHPFAVSDQPTSYDAILYGFLANIISVPIESVLKELACRHSVLVAYVERMRSALERGSGNRSSEERIRAN
jgi:glutathione S-transferase